MILYDGYMDDLSFKREHSLFLRSVLSHMLYHVQSIERSSEGREAMVERSAWRTRLRRKHTNERKHTQSTIRNGCSDYIVDRRDFWFSIFLNVVLRQLRHRVVHFWFPAAENEKICRKTATNQRFPWPSISFHASIVLYFDTYHIKVVTTFIIILGSQSWFSTPQR